MEDLKKRVTCPQCQKLYEDYNSRLLPCLHTFCANCLRELPVKVRVSTPPQAQEESNTTSNQVEAPRSNSDPAESQEGDKASTNSDSSLSCISRTSSTEGNVYKYIECPQCQKQCLLPERGVDGFQNSLIVSDLTSTYKSLENYGRESGPRCGHCVDALLAIAFCHKCRYFLCERCCNMHTQWARDYEGHQVVSLESLEQEEEGASNGGCDLIQNLLKKAQVDPSGSLNVPSFLRPQLKLRDISCYHHMDEKLKCYCSSCRELVCRNCFIIKHQEHATISVTNTVLEDHRTEMKSIASTLGDTANQVEAIQQKTTAEKEDLRKCVSDVRESIVNVFKELEEMLKSRKDELLNQLEKFENEPLQKLESRERELQQLRDQVSESKTYIEENISHTGPTAMLSIERTVVERNTSLSADFTSIPDLEKNPRFQFTSNDHLLEQISTFGELRTLPSEDAVLVGPPHSYSPVSPHVSLSHRSQVLSDRLSLVSSIYPLSEYTSSGSTELDVADMQYQSLTIPIVVSVPRVQGDAVRTIDNIKHPMGLTSANYLVLCNSDHEIVIMSHQGIEMRKFGEKGNENGQFYYPQSVAVDCTEQLLVIDRNHRIQVFDSKGTWLKTVGSRGNSELQFYDPSGITIGANGRVFVCEYSNNRIQVLNSDLSHYKFIGKRGNKSGEFNKPTDIAIDSRGLLYVVDSWNHRIQVITQEGEFVRSMGTKGDGKGELKAPSHICIDPDGFIFVTERRNDRITMFTIRGEFVRCVGGRGEGLGQLSEPSGIAIDLNKNLYVSDYGNNRIQVFK